MSTRVRRGPGESSRSNSALVSSHRSRGKKLTDVQQRTETVKRPPPSPPPIPSEAVKATTSGQGCSTAVPPSRCRLCARVCFYGCSCSLDGESLCVRPRGAHERGDVAVNHGSLSVWSCFFFKKGSSSASSRLRPPDRGGSRSQQRPGVGEVRRVKKKLPPAPSAHPSSLC